MFNENEIEVEATEEDKTPYVDPYADVDVSDVVYVEPTISAELYREVYASVAKRSKTREFIKAMSVLNVKFNDEAKTDVEKFDIQEDLMNVFFGTFSEDIDRELDGDISAKSNLLVSIQERLDVPKE